jgi:hypothetical protein
MLTYLAKCTSKQAILRQFLQASRALADCSTRRHFATNLVVKCEVALLGIPKSARTIV